MTAPPELSLESRRILLALARRAIEARLARRPPPVEDLPPDLREPCGAFVTLKRRRDGDLRGCVGYVEPHFPLAESVARAAVAAATADGRFDPVTAGELAGLSLDVSVLGPVRPIAPEDIRVGVHGLMIRCRGHGGLLLPQVPVEHGWDRVAFLEHTCRKAGLPSGTWEDPDAELYGFTATVFGED
ncbi:MAG: AmmeMemoRadiSam system protein A [Acidobacteria bacterium]|nr:AmmeMemoRadiSam system protein A [Acidobacteriota bacterium]